MTLAGFADEAALRDHARRMQALHIRLLFCDAVRAAWRKEPEAVLREAGLPPEARDRFPDIDGERFRAEIRGRRSVVERSVQRSFAQTWDYLARKAAASGFTATAGLGFERFLCSPWFFEPGRALPHPTGVGPGYENNSKWFFWLRETAGLMRPGADVGLRSLAYAEFANYLIGEYKRPHIPYYDRFKGGLYWPETPGVALPVLFVAEDYRSFKLGNRESVASLARIGLIDLDRLTPPPLPDEPMLR